MKNKMIKKLLAYGLVTAITFTNSQLQVHAQPEDNYEDNTFFEETGDFVQQAATKGTLNVSENDKDNDENQSEEETDDKEKNENIESEQKITIVINEINSAPDDWVELKNIGTEEIDLSGVEIRDNSNDHRFVIAEDTKLGAGQLFVVDAKSYGKVYDDQTDSYIDGQFEEAIGIGSGDSIRVYEKNGTLIDEYSWSEHASYDGDDARASYGRYPDGTGSFVLMPETKNADNECFKPNIVINEVESNGDEADWVEIYNAGTSDVDISGWYILDNEPEKHKTDVSPVAEGTVLAPGAYFVFEEKKEFGFGLGKKDCATVYDKNGEVVASYEWTEHAAGVYARIPNGTGELVDYETSTKGYANTGTEKPEEGKEENLESWPGNGEVYVFDKESMFLEDSSGLDFHNGQLYAIDNGTGKFWVLDVAKDGSMSFAKGFENGKRIIFPKDVNNSKAKGPDTEGITVDGNGYVYAASERDNSDKGVNYNTILKVDPREEGTDLVAVQMWDLTASLPQVSANMGIEAVEWVSNASLNGKLFDQNTNTAFESSNYPNAVADGVFFVALEENGHVYAYVLNNDESVVQIADIDSKLGGAMALDYDTYENTLWVVADNGYENHAARVVFNGTQEANITLVKAPAGVDVSLNNEGFAIAEKTYTINGQRPVYRFQDGVSKGALTVGTIACSYSDNTEDKPITPVVPSTPSTDSGITESTGSSTSDTDATDDFNNQSTTADIAPVVINNPEVPMAETVNEALSTLEMIAIGDDTNVKLNLISKYYGKNLGFMVHLGNHVGISVSAGMMEKINCDMKLGSTFTQLDGFAEGFQTYQMLPKKENAYGFEMGIHMNVGKENHGKSAYIFQKDLSTMTYICKKAMPVSEIGNVAFTTMQMSDVIVLVQE